MQLLVVRRAEESRRGRRRRRSPREPLDVGSLRAVAGDTSRIGWSTCAIAADQQVDALDRFDAADRQHVVAVRAATSAAPRAAADGRAPRAVRPLNLASRCAVLRALAKMRPALAEHLGVELDQPSRRPTSRLDVARSRCTRVPHSSYAARYWWISHATCAGGGRSRSGTSRRSPDRSAGRCSR